MTKTKAFLQLGIALLGFVYAGVEAVGAAAAVREVLR